MPNDPARHEDDLEIARAILAKDESVAEAFFEFAHDRLFRFILSRCGDHHESEEIAQETWVTAIEKLDRYEGTSALLTWICGIARFKVSDRFRRKKRAVRQERIEEFEQAFDTLSQGGGAEGVLELLQEREVREALAATLEILPEEYSQALRLKYLERVPVREIARTLDRGEKATESLLNRARAAFRDLWRVETGEVESARRRKRPRGG